MRPEPVRPASRPLASRLLASLAALGLLAGPAAAQSTRPPAAQAGDAPLQPAEFVAAVNAATLPPNWTDEGGGKNAADPFVVRLQVLLDRAHASPGVIDGRAGGNLRKAIAAFETMHDLPGDGTLTEAAWQALVQQGRATPPVPPPNPAKAVSAKATAAQAKDAQDGDAQGTAAQTGGAAPALSPAATQAAAILSPSAPAMPPAAPAAAGETPAQPAAGKPAASGEPGASGEPATASPADQAAMALDPALGPYTITGTDVAGPFVPDLPKDYGELAKLPALGYRDPVEELSERFHTAEDFLRGLNPGADFAKAGTVIVVPRLGMPASGSVAKLVADKARKELFGFDHDGHILVAYPATIGSSALPSPSGTHTVTAVVRHADYWYRPDVNFKQGNNDKPLRLAPGPNNPIGSVWIDLSKPTYGIHGTPEPDDIDKTRSHGCVRLTNWNVEELAGLVAKGVTVTFKD